MEFHLSFAITCIFALHVIQTTQASQDLVGTSGFARYDDGKYHRGNIVPSNIPDRLSFLSNGGTQVSFSNSEWQAFVPDIIPDTKSTPVGSRIITPQNSDTYQAGTIVYIAPSYTNYKVRHDGGGESDWDLNQLRIMLPGLAEFGRDCLDLLYKGYTEDGVYYIYPGGNGFIKVYCDQKTNGGGWTVFQRRLNGSVDFFRDWNSYKVGFGDFTSEFWLGNDDIHQIASQDSQLLIELKDFGSPTGHASYESFHVGSEAEKYVLHIAEFSGTVGDSMATHNGMKFSTKDQDNGNMACAQTYTGAWWYRECHSANLNGQHGVDAYGQGICWTTWKGLFHSLKETAMKVKPRRERDWFYELVFSGTPSDYVLLPRITDLMDAIISWWIKTEAVPGWSEVFSLYNYDNTSILSFSYSGNGSCWFHVSNENRFFFLSDFVITDGYWHHVAIKWLSSTGTYKVYIDGIRRTQETVLAPNYQTTIGYLIIGGFKGNLTGFNMWDKTVHNNEIKLMTRSTTPGNIVAWPEVQFWRIGNVTKKNSSFCKLSGFQSSLISHIPSYQDTLMKRLSLEPLLCKRYWVPCFRGTVDGWQSHTFHSNCDNKGPTLTLARKDSYLFGGFADQSWKNHTPAQSIPSQKAFLFSLKPFNTNYQGKGFELMPEKKDQAMRGASDKGPCWGMDAEEMCFSPRDVKTKVGSSGVFNDNGIPDLDTFFTGELSSQADDVEVLILADYTCDPPCREDEMCDQNSGKCICDPTFRAEEFCWLRQELQDLRDKHCRDRWTFTRSDCHRRLFARYDVTDVNSTRAWRCYYEESLTGDRRRYDTEKASNCYSEDNELELQYYTNEVPPMPPLRNCRPLGMESHYILDSQISASSEYNAAHGARNARLNFQANNGIIGAWLSLHQNVNQWLQVDFIKTTTLVKVATQGRMDHDRWVTSYSLSHSMDTSSFEMYQHGGAVKIFDGNSDRNTIVSHVINPVIFTRYIRILPKTWSFKIAMRAEFYDCDVPPVRSCRPVGMESHYILDSQISASSAFSAAHGARNARLNFQANNGIKGAWAPLHNNVNQWLQVDFIKTTTLVKVATQGRMDYSQWVTSYSLSHSMDTSSFEMYQHGDAVKIFDGNSDRNTIVSHVINPVIFTRYIRILPKTWFGGWIGLRAELYDCDGYDVFEVDDLRSDSIYHWTLDDVNDIKDLKSETWAQVNGSLQPTAGVRGGAVKASGGTGTIRLTQDVHGKLIGSDNCTLSLWLLYQSKGPAILQTFLAVGDQENQGKGTLLYQEDGSREKLTLQLTTNIKRCSLTFGVPQRLWSHLVFILKESTSFADTEVYRNGKIVPDVARHCYTDEFSNFPNLDIKLGSNQFPLASFDDFIIWGKALTALQVEALFRFYKGGANLHVNVSVELTDEMFHSELMKSGSKLFHNKTSFLETQVKSLYGVNSITKVDNFLFWNITHVAVNFTVRFSRTGYKEIEPLETSLVSRSMLGSIPAKFVAMEANDVYTTPLRVIAYNTSSTSLAVSWNEPRNLTYGIFCGVEILYRLNDSSQKFSVMVTSLEPGYELTNLELYTLYVISARPHTLEGEGKESDDVLARTGEAVPTSPPLNANAFLNNSGNLISVTWEPVPVELRRGIIQGYSIMYTIQANGYQQEMTVNAPSLSVEIKNLQIYALYSITVTAFNIAGRGPPSHAAMVRSIEGVPSLAPPVVVAHGTSFTSIMVTWKAIPEDHVRGILKCYVVTLALPDGTVAERFGCPSSFSVTFQDLEKSTVYKVKVAGCTSKGQGNFSEDVRVITDIDGCRALGMEDRNISDSQITASSVFSQHHAASNARLYYQGVGGSNWKVGSWTAHAGDSDPWLQVDFETKVTIVQVATQGRFQLSQWVKSYSLKYSHDGANFEVYKQFGEVKIFQGNWDSNTVVYNAITPLISARFIRILPKTWFDYRCMRAEFYSCEYDLTIDPVNVTSAIQNSTSVGISWVSPDPYKLGEAVSEYRVEVVDLLRGESVNITVNSSSTDVQLDFLKPFTSYEFKVFGSTSSWEGNITDTISLKTQEDAPSEPPRNFTVQHSTASETTLQWKPVHEYSINGRLQGYKVIYKETNSPTNTWKTIIINVNATQQSRWKRSVEDNTVSFNLEDLKSYTTYSVIVLAFTIRDGVPTLEANFTTVEDVPDHSPINVTAYNTSSTSINVTWQPIPSEHVNGILMGYHVIYRRVYKVNDNISMVTVNSTSLNTELTGLGKYKLYSIQVAGRTVVGLGNFSYPVFVRTEQDVPDDPPGNIRAIGIEPTVIKAYWLPVSNETINGIALGYKLALFTIAGENIRNYNNLSASVLSLEIIGLDIWTNYSIKMAAFTVVGDGPWSDLILEDTDEEVPYKPPASLTGEVTNSTSIFVEWDPVDLPNIRGILRGYTVFYEEAPSSVHPSVLRNITVDISVTDAQLVNLHKYTEYHIWVTAFTTRDGLPSNSIFLQTHEDIPERPPLYITYSSPGSTTILLHWGPVPPRFKNGIIIGFKVEYQENQPDATTQVRERSFVNWVLLGDLKKFTEYAVRVRACTSIGYGPENSIIVLTSQDVPSKPPNSIKAESHVTLTTIPVTWQPIDPYYIHGVLIGYKIRYQAVAVGQEPVDDQPITEERVDSSTLSLVLTNLEIFTVYRVDVLGYTIIGDGPPATDYAETCRCHKRLTTSWYEFPPYVQASENNIPSGLIPPILSKLAVTCCETCQSHGTSYVDLSSNGFNQSAELPDLRTLKSSIANPTDFFFPVYGFSDQTHFAGVFGYQGLVESPGMAYVINTNSQDDMPNAVLNNIFSCWPAVMLFMVITYLSGLVVWAVESPVNPKDFPPSFTKGVPEGFYWAFVSMTTVGYGDRAPITIMGRIISIVVILTGLVLLGLVNGILCTSITSVALETDYIIYGAKVAAIAETPEYRMGVRKNAKMDEDHLYHTFEDIYTALRERKVAGALIDTYSAGSSKEMFAKEQLRVNKILDNSATYGVVMGREARKLRKCFKDFTQRVFASEFSQHIQKNTEQLKEPADSLPLERSTGLFDSNSIVFQNTLLLTVMLLVSSLLLGIIYEIIRWLRSRAKVKPQDLRQTFLDEMKAMVENFNQNMNTIKETMEFRHKNERKTLLLSYKEHPNRKYTSMAELTQDVFATLQPENDEADC